MATLEVATELTDERLASGHATREDLKFIISLTERVVRQALRLAERY
jgi:hypothetical protein